MKETFLPTSTNISQVDYDGESQTMTIIFKDGRAWEYAGVPLEVYMAFQRAPSAGSFFYRQIRGRFPEQEV